MKSRLAVLIVASALAAVACRHDGDAVLLVVVTASGSPPPVSSLDVTLTGPAGASTASYARANGEAIAFPTTLTAIVPSGSVGDIVVDVHAKDAVGAVLAAGHEGPVSVRGGDHDTVFVELQCGDNPCLPGGGPPDGGPDASPSCGNGRVDQGETCDTAIAGGAPGACPPSDCNDQVGCLRAVPTGNACTAHCEPITATVAGDGCCPANATNATDPDCSAKCGDGVVDPGETCDTGIPAGSPGACPMTVADCASGDACSIDRLISAGTCSAVCVHAQITAPSPSDGCCPPGANHLMDSDCPVVCGDGVRESPESCDLGIPPLANSACPVGCDDGDACTIDVLSDPGSCAARCSSHIPIIAPISGDGCCPPGANHATDSDCPPTCGNGVIEPGETCDGDSGPFGCPTSCPTPSACLKAEVVGSRDDCSAHCVTTIVTECSPQTDGCCPQGCDSSNDPDCSPVCGDGALQPTRGELCEISFPATSKKACPASCVPLNACSPELLVSAGTCGAQCVVVPITAVVNGDGCCPYGADATVDADCAPKCDNHVVEPPGEACDPSVPGSCPTSCPASPSACTVVEMQGKLGTCGVRCVTQTIVGCLGGDGCCPAGCTALTDSDCPPVCGDGAVEAGEACDRGITAGAPGACPRSCDDADACTLDLTDGAVANCTRSCTHVAVTACLGGDGCCPIGCTAASDSDCSPVCGDGHVGAGETCDTAIARGAPGACPTSCPDDGDPCTREQITGDPALCTAACQHLPITTCSGSTTDACCPTGCTPASDSDC